MVMTAFESSKADFKTDKMAGFALDKMGVKAAVCYGSSDSQKPYYYTVQRVAIEACEVAGDLPPKS